MLIDPGIRTSDVNGVYTYVSGSYFAMFADAPNDPSFAAMLTRGSAGGIVLGTHQNFVLDPNTPHPDNWDGMGGSAGSGYAVTAATISTVLKPFFFFGNPTYVGANPIAYQSGMAHSAPPRTSAIAWVIHTP